MCPTHTFSLPLSITATARPIFSYQLLCKLQIEFSPCLCRPHLSDDFIAFMESFVVQLPFSPVFFEIEMTQTRYRCFKMGTKRGKPVGWFAFCFSLSPRSSEVLGQFLAFGGGSVLTGAWLCVPFCHSVYTLDQHRGSPFFWPPSLSLHPSTLKGTRWSSFFCLVFHMHTGKMSCSPLQRVGTWLALPNLLFWPTAKFLNYYFTNSV